MVNTATIMMLALVAVIGITVTNTNSEENYAFAGSNSTGGGCSGDCTPPTMGILDGQYGRMFVTDGFIFGDLVFQVDRYHVETPLINLAVGETVTIKAKYYENTGHEAISHFGLSIDIDDGGFTSGRATVEYQKDAPYSETWEKVITDPSNLLNVISVTKQDVVCNDETDTLCKQFTVRLSVNEPLTEAKVMTRAWDDSRNDGSNLFNEGLTITGDSLNPLPSYQVMSRDSLDPIKTVSIIDASLQDLTVGVDEDGNTWNLLDNGFWSQEIGEVKPITDDPLNRNSAFFKSLKEYEAQRAYYTLNN